MCVFTLRNIEHDILYSLLLAERDVALKFFQSLAGTQFMGGSAGKKEKVDQVVGLLRK